jgi:hypothetical protein
MSQKRNSASRLADALSEALAQPENITTADVWLKVFRQPKAKSAHEKFFFASNRMSLLFFELDNVRGYLKGAGFSTNTYEPSLEKIENTISPSVLHVGWAAVKPNLSLEVLTSLNFCKDLMPDEEIEISEEDLKSLAEDIDSLEAHLENSELPTHLRSVIQKYIDSIWEALDEYPITGAKSLKSANKKIIGELIEAQEEIKQSAEQPAVKKFGTLFKRVNDIADTAIKADKLMQIGHKVVDALQQLF